MGCSDHRDDEPRRLADTANSSALTTGPTAADAGEEPVASYTAWLDALAGHDVESAYARHAPELTIELRQRAIVEDRAELGNPCAGFVALLWEDPTFDSEIVDIGEPQMWWARDQYDFRVCLDVDGSELKLGLELIGDHDALNAEDRGEPTCPELRR